MQIEKNKQTFDDYKLEYLKMSNKIKNQETQKGINFMASGILITENNNYGKLDNPSEIKYPFSGNCYL